MADLLSTVFGTIRKRYRDMGDGTHAEVVSAVEHPAGSILSGELAGATSATQLPNVACRLVRFRARLDNAGNVYIGASGVTRPDGTTNATTGFELGPGDDTGWLPTSNLNKFYRICDNAGDDLTYLAVN